MLRIAILYCFLVLGWASKAQLVDPNEIVYDRELTFGIHMNTQGGLLSGINLRYITKLNSQDWLNTSLEIANVKHPKEIKASSPAGSSFLLGKVNYLFAIRPQIGIEKRIFRKDDQDGIRVHAVLAGGPTIGLLKPYYVEYITEQRIGDTIYVVSDYVAYNPEIHSLSQIAGSGGFFRGFDEMKAVLGFNAKIGLNFEFGLFEERVTGVEVGYMVEGFTRNLNIHEVPQKQQFFNSVYLNIFFGTKYPAKSNGKLTNY